MMFWPKTHAIGVFSKETNFIANFVSFFRVREYEEITYMVRIN